MNGKLLNGSFEPPVALLKKQEGSTNIQDYYDVA